MNNQHQHSFWASFIVYFVVSALIITLSLGAFYLVDIQYRAKATSTSERLQVALGHKLTDSLLQDVIRDLRILEHSPAMVDYLENPAGAGQAQVETLFLSMIQHKEIYDQIRFLDVDGMERIRVNHAAGHPHVVATGDLQDKSRRYYFSDTIRLVKNEAFISPLDLNIENGQIEVPHKPMIRVGTPVFDTQGTKTGILLINYLATNLLADIREVMAGSLGQIDLINADGYWIMSHDPEIEWGFMFGNPTNFSLLYPDAWQTIRATDTGQIVLENELYTWQTIYVLLANTVSSTGSAEAHGFSRGHMGKDDYYWKLMTHIPRDVYDHQIRENLFALLILFSILIVLAAIGSALIARLRIREKHFLNQLVSSEARQKAITECLAEGVIITDRDGKITASNPEAEKLLDCKESDLLMRTLSRELDPLVTDSAFKKVMDSGEILHVEEDSFHKCSKGEISVAYTASPLIINDVTEGIILVFEDISQRKELKDRLAFLATHDELTGIFNRREITSILDFAFNKARRYRTPLSICMFDLDYFKSINDEHGHQTGDLVLQLVGQLLMEGSRSADAPGRYGGEEFIAVLAETELAGAVKWAESIRDKINELHIKPSSSDAILSITISCGVAEYDDTMSKTNDLIAAADKALYRAKESGRNRICIFDCPGEDNRLAD